jgi:hypothetical protein
LRPAPGSGEDPVDLERLESLKSSYSTDTRRVFLQAAFAPEDGKSRRRVRKWSDDIRIKVIGSPTSQDRRTLEQPVEELRPRLGSVRIGFENDDANVEVFFLPSGRLVAHELNYNQGSRGVYWCWWSRTGVMSKARMGFAVPACLQFR